MNTHQHEDQKSGRRIHGLLAEFSAVDPLLRAAKRVRDAGYTRWDVHTPFPVHGLDQAMGVRPTRLPWFILFMGLTGVTCAFLLQWWTNAYDYPFRISGKPFWSVPANVPIAFELTVLFSAFAAFFLTLGRNKLPALFRPLFGVERFKRATDDKFFVVIENADPLFHATRSAELLRSCGSDHVETIITNTIPADFALPKKVVGWGLVLMALTLLPLALAVRARWSTSAEPRLHVFSDMDFQKRLKPQQSSRFFADGLAMRRAPEHTVARGELRDDTGGATGMHTGKDAHGRWLSAIPGAVSVDAATVDRGQERFGIYCAVCHGAGGRGDGLVAQRAEALQEGTWVAPTSLHAQHVRDMPEGQLFASMSFGVRNMPGYAAQILPEDRWAIVAYVRALQLSQFAPQDDVPRDVLPTLR